MLCASALASAEEFKCPEGTKDSGYRPGIIVRWCEISRDGRLLYHGPVWRWHRNGQMESKEYYVYGNAEGETLSWYENGKMSSLGSFKNGSKSGLWKYWDESGRIKTEATYAETGSLWTEYYPSGRKMAVGTFYRSGKIGAWVYWDKDGKEKARCDFGNGLFNLPNKACQIIAEELEPKGYSRPLAEGLKTKDGNAAVRIASQLYEFTTPAGWIADMDAGKTEQTPLVFYPKGGTWRGSDPNIYIRPVFKEGKFFDRVIENEKEGFQENVAEYVEKLSGGGKTKNGKSYIIKAISYKPLFQTDSPFSIVSDNVIHEMIGFVDVSDNVVLMIVLTCHGKEQMREAFPHLMTLISSLNVQPTKEVGQ